LPSTIQTSIKLCGYCTTPHNQPAATSREALCGLSPSCHSIGTEMAVGNYHLMAVDNWHLNSARAHSPEAKGPRERPPPMCLEYQHTHALPCHWQRLYRCAHPPFYSLGRLCKVNLPVKPHKRSLLVRQVNYMGQEHWPVSQPLAAMAQWLLWNPWANGHNRQAVPSAPSAPTTGMHRMHLATSGC
jgi:hypothetical protein